MYQSPSRSKTAVNSLCMASPHASLSDGGHHSTRRPIDTRVSKPEGHDAMSYRRVQVHDNNAQVVGCDRGTQAIDLVQRPPRFTCEGKSAPLQRSIPESYEAPADERLLSYQRKLLPLL